MVGVESKLVLAPCYWLVANLILSENFNSTEKCAPTLFFIKPSFACTSKGLQTLPSLLYHQMINEYSSPAYLPKFSRLVLREIKNKEIRNIIVDTEFSTSDK